MTPIVSALTALFALLPLARAIKMVVAAIRRRKQPQSAEDGGDGAS
jgi:hypothetical protein